MSGRATGTDTNGDTLSFGFIDANGAQVTSIVTPYGVMAMAPDGPTPIPSTTLIPIPTASLLAKPVPKPSPST